MKCTLAIILISCSSSLSAAETVKIQDSTSSATPMLREADQRDRYKLQPGDQLKVKFRLTPEFNEDVTIQPDGYIQLAVCGDLRLTTLTVKQAEAEIAKRAAERRLNNPEVSIELASFQKPYFVVAGEVARPGRFEMHEITTAVQALMMAGGPSVDASSNHILIFRRLNQVDQSNRSSAQVMFFKFKDGKAAQQMLEEDRPLESGDIIYVSRSRISKISQVTKIGNNLGLYVNPLTAIP